MLACGTLSAMSNEFAMPSRKVSDEFLGSLGWDEINCVRLATNKLSLSLLLSLESHVVRRVHSTFDYIILCSVC